MVPAVVLMNILAQLRLVPFAPYHWHMFGESLYFDIGRPTRELGWEPKWANVEMFCQSYDWYVAHRDELSDGKPHSIHRSPVREGVLRVLKWIS